MKNTKRLIQSELDPQEEQYTTFYSHIMHCILFQYDYRASNGELFSCVDRTLMNCIERRDLWLEAKGLES